jgi:hypothetical protein
MTLNQVPVASDSSCLAALSPYDSRQETELTRTVALTLCVLLTSCTPVHFAMVPDPDRPMALLRVNTDKPDPLGWGHGRIWTVDNRFITAGQVDSVYVYPGQRAIGYACPGTLYLDAATPDKVEYLFAAGVSYEIVVDCDSGPVIRPIVKLEKSSH